MGTNNVGRICQIPNATKAQVQKWIADRQDEDTREHGHEDGYSGYWNSCTYVTLLDKVYPSYDAVRDSLEDTEKRSIVGARYEDNVKDGVPWNETEQAKATRAKLNDIYTQIQAAKVVGMRNRNNRKTKLVGCDNCGSKVSAQHLRTNQCPVCNQGQWFGWLQADVEKVLRLEKQEAKIISDAKVREEKHESKRKVRSQGMKWYVLGACPC